jgi:hypothetical protein
MLAFCLHVPINVIHVLARGVNMMIFVGLVLILPNLACLGAALWNLDIMRGKRLFYRWM